MRQTNRLDWKRGRFTLNSDANSFRASIQAWQGYMGTEVQYWRFQKDLSYVNDVYDEGDKHGKVFHPPFILPVLQAVRAQGTMDNQKEGTYFNEELHMSVAFDEMVRVGLTDLYYNPAERYLDRVIYDSKVYRIMAVNVGGKLQERPMMVGLDATQVKPDELINDAQFKRWSA